MIEEHIPFGYKNRISRTSLSVATRLGDRKMRKEIEAALIERGVLIVNIDDGYFRPDGSPEDKERAKAYLLREQARTYSCSKRCKAIVKCLTPKREDELTKNQMSLSQFGIL